MFPRNRTEQRHCTVVKESSKKNCVAIVHIYFDEVQQECSEYKIKFRLEKVELQLFIRKYSDGVANFADI